MRLFGDLKPGDRALISDLSELLRKDVEFAERLMQMGLTEGSEIEVLHNAPFGGGVAIQVRGTRIGLRNEDLLCVKVKKL